MESSEENCGTKSFLIRDLLSDLMVKNENNNENNRDDDVDCDGKCFNLSLCNEETSNRAEREGNLHKICLAANRRV